MGLRQTELLGTRASIVMSEFGPDPDDAPAYDEEPRPVLAVGYESDWYNVGAYEIGAYTSNA